MKIKKLYNQIKIEHNDIKRILSLLPVSQLAKSLGVKNISTSRTSSALSNIGNLLFIVLIS